LINCGINANDTYYGIELVDTATYNTIVNNNIKETAANKLRYCIAEAAAADNYNLIVGNIAQSAVTANIVTLGANTVSANNIT
jgi:hypothetical protein